VSISPGGFSDPSWRPDSGGGSGRPRLFTLVLLVAVLALAGATAYLFTTLQATQSRLTAANEKLQAHDEQIAKLEDSVLRTSKQAEQNISTLRGEVSSTKGQISQATKQVESQVLSKTEQLTQKLSAEHKAEVAKVGSEVEQLKSATNATETKLGSLTGDVTGVKNDVSQTKNELQKTIAELKSVRGDLGVQSGLVATNGTELAALKRLGERNYFEFDLKKVKQPQKVGNITLRLKGTDTKRNKYTLELIADDKLTEKKDKNLNEPVQFYVAKAKIPYEIVVNQVGKDRIVGYLATPKDQGR
jgi:chromosome segregation ATPase